MMINEANTAQTVEITLNGSVHKLTGHPTVTALVAELNLTGKAIAVAVNRNVITRESWDDHQLQSHDIVDVVRAIGGG